MRYLFGFLNFSIQQKIGKYGPFSLDNHFTFSNFSEWGSAHNNGFQSCIEECKNKICFIDIGAHIGLVSLSAASVMSSKSKVISFEPSITNFNLLKKHVNLNKFSNRIFVEKTLLGEENKLEKTFFQSKQPTGMNSIVDDKKNSYEPTKVRQITLDFYFKNTKFKPDLMKIDVEGAEINVLMGAMRTIKKFKPIIYLSVHPSSLKKLGQSTKMLSNLINDLDYTCHEINGKPVKSFQLKEYKLLPNLNEIN